MSFLRQKLVRAKDRSRPSSSSTLLEHRQGSMQIWVHCWSVVLVFKSRQEEPLTCRAQPPAADRARVEINLEESSQRPVIVREGENHFLSPVCLSARSPCSPAQTREPQLSNAFFRCHWLPFSSPYLVVLDSSVSYLVSWTLPIFLHCWGCVQGLSVSPRPDESNFSQGRDC